ncbi:MAG: Arm DNA-binding domain-containing protein [Acidimicrobiia bacterium]
MRDQGCRACGRTVTIISAKRCAQSLKDGSACGGEVAWAFVVDVGAAGAKRRPRRTRSGFATKKEAVAVLREVQQADSKGKLVEPISRSRHEALCDLDRFAGAKRGHGRKAFAAVPLLIRSRSITGDRTVRHPRRKG